MVHIECARHRSPFVADVRTERATDTTLLVACPKNCAPLTLFTRLVKLVSRKIGTPLKVSVARKKTNPSLIVVLH